MSARKTLAVLLAFAILPTAQSFSQQTAALEQYVYVLKVAPRFQEETSWTDAENAVVARHFERLAKKAFGLVIFEAASETAARRFMQSDPAVTAGLMTATLHPYAVALQR